MKKRKLELAMALFLAAGLLMLSALQYVRLRQQGAGEGPLTGERGSPDWVIPLAWERAAGTAAPQPPDVAEPLARAMAQNSDTVGWLYVPGTRISEAVYQAGDNAFYNRRDGSKRASYPGSVYMDYECRLGDGSAGALPQNLIVYGHNLGDPRGVRDAPDSPDSGKFGPLLKFTEEGFAREHPYVYFATPAGVHTYELFAGSYVEAASYYIHPSYTFGDLQRLVLDMRSRSCFTYNVALSARDKIITLQTCTHKYGTAKQNPNQRFVLLGRLVQPGEGLYRTADIAVNGAPKQPDFSRY